MCPERSVSDQSGHHTRDFRALSQRCHATVTATGGKPRGWIGSCLTSRFPVAESYRHPKRPVAPAFDTPLLLAATSRFMGRLEVAQEQITFVLLDLVMTGAPSIAQLSARP
jgi:hypothetical protein